MMVSVIIRTEDEADRLRLTLASLASQAVQAEVVVVNDGSSDHTPAVLAEAAGRQSLRVVTHARPHGRSGAANAGARSARGEVVLFLDGDTLAGPEVIARHARVQAAGDSLIGRGETFHLRGTRFFQDPEAGTPRQGEEARVARMTSDELARLRVTRAQVTGDFAAIDDRAEPGIYPGAGPRRLYELEMDALRRFPDCTVLWAAASGSNLSVRREAFLRVGGFDEALDINEHRELALRLCESGHRMVPVDGARTYHLTHRSGWRDPLQETGWEDVFYRAHPIQAVKLLAPFWAGLSQAAPVPGRPRIGSLPELAAAAGGGAA
jgi:glycosyltransferase involved in cell wall biosynthesis